MLEELDPKVEIKESLPTDIVPLTELLPPSLYLIPVAGTTLFPGMIVPLVLPEGKLSKTVDHVLEKQGYAGVVLVKNPAREQVAKGPATSITGLPPEGSAEIAEKQEGDLVFYPYGVAVKILKKINLPDNQISILVSGLHRFEIKKVISHEPYWASNVGYLYEKVERGTELEALLRSSISQFKQISKDNPLISEEIKVALINIDGPGKLSDLMASVLIRDVESYQKYLKLSDVKERLQFILLLLKKEHDVQAVQRKIQEEINQKVASSQREFYLQEQLKAIHKELGRSSDNRSRIEKKFEKRLKDLNLSKEAKTAIKEEMEKLDNLHEQSSEYSVCINYLEWATSLPWGIRSTDNYDLDQAKSTLDKDHYGLKDVKDRILEFLAVRKLKQNTKGSILCFVGPPGTGKTSLGKSVAKALNRKFFRFSVGGMRDEAEIKGHRRTYVGAMPGKIIQGLKRVGKQNPVFLIDEVDKIGTSWASGGDPSSALLEVLDPEQNHEFLDHYLDIPFDCSEVFFITTANTTDTIPSALLDRMEIIYLSGYTDSEKWHIAKKYLIPKQLKENALKTSQVKLSDAILKQLISQYARESGVRALEKFIAKIFRKVAYQIATQNKTLVHVDDPKMLTKYLGPPPYQPEVGPEEKVGVATGLAWTQYGGEVLFIESLTVPGKGGFVLTGSLGDVMQESGNIAYTFVRNYSSKLDLPRNYFDRNIFHLHVPAGATPKDGPSAGVTMAVSLYSTVSKIPLPKDLAMTGELTLTGKILPVGGIKEKLLAAKRTHIHKLLLPKDNEKDVKELDKEIKEGLQIKFVTNIADVYKILFENRKK